MMSYYKDLIYHEILFKLEFKNLIPFLIPFTLVTERIRALIINMLVAIHAGWMFDEIRLH
jgi:hypothetical protein